MLHLYHSIAEICKNFKCLWKVNAPDDTKVIVEFKAEGKLLMRLPKSRTKRTTPVGLIKDLTLFLF